jgi:ATP dependent DNA ligase domain
MTADPGVRCHRFANVSSRAGTAFAPSESRTRPYSCCHYLFLDVSTAELRHRLNGGHCQIHFELCLPRPAEKPPSGPEWIHEIKHDGFRLIAHREASDVWLITRNGRDFSDRFPSIRLAAAALPVQSCIIDAEVIACDDNGLAVFELIRNYRPVAWAGPLRVRST